MYAASKQLTKRLLNICFYPESNPEDEEDMLILIWCQTPVFPTGRLPVMRRICTCSVISQMTQFTATIQRATSPSWQNLLKICIFYQMHDGMWVRFLDLIYG